MMGTFLRWFSAPFVVVIGLALLFNNPWLLLKIVAVFFGFLGLAAGLFFIASRGRKG